MKNVREITYGQYRIDSNFNILSVDDNFTKVTGYTEDEALNMTHLDLIPKEDREEYLVAVMNLLATKQEAYIEHRLRRKDGKIIYVFCLGYYNYDRNGNYVDSMIRITSIDKSLSALHQKQEFRDTLNDVKEASNSDDLTGLLRRDAYREKIKAKLLEGDKASIFLIDVDNFKAINDTFGHQAGDEVLKAISDVFNSLIEEDDLGCRFGGDEFSLALFNRDIDDLEKIASSLIERVGKITIESAPLLKVGISVGITNRMGYEDDFEAVYQLADEALYDSKRNGKNCYSISYNKVKQKNRF